MNTKKLTIRYWKSLEKDSKERALKHVFPIHESTVKMLLNETPTKEGIKEGLWNLVFKQIREVLPDEDGIRYYKTCFNRNTYIY